MRRLSKNTHSSSIDEKRAQLEKLPLRELVFRARCVDSTYDIEKESPLKFIIKSPAFIEAHRKPTSQVLLLEYLATCEICFTKTNDGKRCENNHFICKECLIKWLKFKFEEMEVLLSCPVDPECKCIFAASMVFQYLQNMEIEEYYHKLVFMKYQVGRKFITCLKCGYGEEYEDLELMQNGYIWQCKVPDTLKIGNRGCQKVYCLNCVPVTCLADNIEQYFTLSQVNPHECTKDPAMVMRARIADTIADAYFPSCPNDAIRFIKEIGCNCVKCSHCNEYFCYLCSTKLGKDGKKAHDMFNKETHHNKMQKCNIFESEKDDEVMKEKARILISNMIKQEKWEIAVVNQVCGDLLSSIKFSLN